MSPASAALTVERACVGLGGRQILREVSFTLAPGEFCGLIGSNGSGKTTLLRAMHGMLRLSGRRELAPEAAKQAMVFQRPVSSKESSGSLWISRETWAMPGVYQ